MEPGSVPRTRSSGSLPRKSSVSTSSTFPPMRQRRTAPSEPPVSTSSPDTARAEIDEPLCAANVAVHVNWAQLEAFHRKLLWTHRPSLARPDAHLTRLVAGHEPVAAALERCDLRLVPDERGVDASSVGILR